MSITFLWLTQTLFPFVGKILGVITSFACSKYSVVSPLLRNFFGNTVQTLTCTNLFTGAEFNFVFTSTLPSVLDTIFNLASQVVWWLLDAIVNLFQLANQPFVFAVLAVIAVFFLPFLGFRFVRMIVGG